jgi:hypothetical protein
VPIPEGVTFGRRLGEVRTVAQERRPGAFPGAGHPRTGFSSTPTPSTSTCTVSPCSSRLVKHPALLARMERRLVRAMWAWQRRCAKRLGMKGKLHGGGVGFRQYFGSALQLTPHLHVLVPEGQWTDGAGWVGVPPPDTEDVERILRRVMKGLVKDFGEVGEGWAEDGLEALWLEGVQHRLPLGEEPKRERRGRRVAVLESRREDGRYEYRTRKGQVLELTAQGLVKRLVALIPPKGVHLTRFHRVFAPNAKLRARVVRARKKEGWPKRLCPGAAPGA